MNRVRELVEDLWVQLQVDYEKRQMALYAALGAFALLSMLPSRRVEERRAQALADALARALNQTERTGR